MRQKGKPYPRAFQVPKFDIEFLVNKEHVGTPDDAIAAMITDRCERAGVAPENIALCVKYALKVHTGNRKLYSSVMSGSLGPKERKKSNG
jgi:hypothetical protein